MVENNGNVTTVKYINSGKNLNHETKVELKRKERKKEKKNKRQND